MLECCSNELIPLIRRQIFDLVIVTLEWRIPHQRLKILLPELAFPVAMAKLVTVVALFVWDTDFDILCKFGGLSTLIYLISKRSIFLVRN